MNKLGEIIRRLRTEKDMSQRELADAAGMGQSDISKLERGTMGETTGIVRLAMALDVSPIYLETGDERYAGLSAFAPPTASPQSSVPMADDVYVPITNASAAMGYGREQPSFEQVVDYVRMSRSWVRTELPYISSVENLALIPAFGPSMEPTFRSGDLLIVDRGVTAIRNDAVYVFSFNGQTFVKRIIRNPVTKTITAKSDNELHGSFEIDNSHADDLHVLGMVLYAWRGKKL